MAQDLVASGVDLAAVMRAGRWETTRQMARYTRALAADRERSPATTPPPAPARCAFRIPPFT